MHPTSRPARTALRSLVAEALRRAPGARVGTPKRNAIVVLTWLLATIVVVGLLHSAGVLHA